MPRSAHRRTSSSSSCAAAAAPMFQLASSCPRRASPAAGKQAGPCTSVGFRRGIPASRGGTIRRAPRAAELESLYCGECWKDGTIAVHLGVHHREPFRGGGEHEGGRCPPRLVAAWRPRPVSAVRSRHPASPPPRPTAAARGPPRRQGRQSSGRPSTVTRWSPPPALASNQHRRRSHTPGRRRAPARRRGSPPTTPYDRRHAGRGGPRGAEGSGPRARRPDPHHHQPAGVDLDLVGPAPVGPGAAGRSAGARATLMVYGYR